MTGTNDCKRFDACLDLLIAGSGLLTPEQTQFFRSHLACCARCSHQASYLEALGNLEQDEQSDHPPLTQEALRRTFHHVSQKQDLRNTTTSMGARWIFSFAGATASIFVLIIWMLWPPDASQEPDGLESPTTSSCCTVRVGQAEGHIGRNGQAIQLGDELNMGDRIQTHAGSVRLSLADESQLVVHKQTVLEILRTTQREHRFRVEQGRVLFQVTPLAPGHSFWVDLKEGQIQVIGTIFEVYYTTGALAIDVREGKVLFIPTSGKKQIIPAGHRFRTDRGVYTLSEQTINPMLTTSPSKDESDDHRNLEGEKRAAHRKRVAHLAKPSQQKRKTRAKTRRVGRSKKKKRARSEENTRANGSQKQKSSARSRSFAYSPSRTLLGSNQSTQTPRQSMAELFDLARRLRAEGRWAEVVKTYKRIMRQYPASSEATTCLVLMGKVQLEKQQDAKAASASFRQYLDLVGSGALVEETRWALAAALRQMGDKQEEIRVLERFVKHHPQSRFFGLAKKRLEALE